MRFFVCIAIAVLMGCVVELDLDQVDEAVTLVEVDAGTASVGGSENCPPDMEEAGRCTTGGGGTGGGGSGGEPACIWGWHWEILGCGGTGCCVPNPLPPSGSCTPGPGEVPRPPGGSCSIINGRCECWPPPPPPVPIASINPGDDQ